MRPLQISPETAVKLAKELNIPIEHLMHMPQHILIQKLAQLAKQDKDQRDQDQSQNQDQSQQSEQS